MSAATDRAAIERRIVGALQNTIAAHGPITANRIGSAAKRLYGELYKTPTLPAREPLDCLRLEGRRVILRAGDVVDVHPSRPGRHDAWTGTIISLFRDAGGPTIQVTCPGQAPRCITPARIKSRKKKTAAPRGAE